MGGWNYFEDSPSPRAYWNYGPGDYDEGPDPADYAEDGDREWDDEDEERFGPEPHPDDIFDPGFTELSVGSGRE
jgi:hypothetical protein